MDFERNAMATELPGKFRGHRIDTTYAKAFFR
jgi:hypothetical protein